MAEGLHYPLYVRTPSKLDITFEQFDNLSVIGLGSLLVSWPAVIHKNIVEKRYEIYANYSNGWRILELKRIKDKNFKAWDYSSVEMYRIDIPEDDDLIPVIIRKFSHLIFEGD